MAADGIVYKINYDGLQFRFMKTPAGAGIPVNVPPLQAA